MKIQEIASVCHEANRELCNALRDDSQQSWMASPEWQRASAIAGVKFCLDNPKAPASANHNAWLKQKKAEGWVYGEVKDAEKKTHPCIVPYKDLPPEQQAKDHLFKAVVSALAPLLTP